jgi:sortase A
VIRLRALTVIGAIGELALTVGVLLLFFVLWLVFWTGHRGAVEAARTVSSLQKQWNSIPAQQLRDENPLRDDGPRSIPKPAPGQPFAVLRVPRFGSHWQMPVREGTGRDVLREGVGHYVGTALPGAVGNLALAGHRTTWGQPFHDIERLRTGDEVRVQTRWARFTYRVTGHQIVRPSQRDVLDPVPGQPRATPDQAVLTLTTCHPEYSARQRWVVRAVLVSATASVSVSGSGSAN